MNFKFLNLPNIFPGIKPIKVWLSAAFALILILWILIFSIDSFLLSRNDTARNLNLGSEDISRTNRSSLEQLVVEIAKEEAERPVTLFLPEDAQINATLFDIGIEVDIAATVDAALDADKGFGPLRIFSWSRSFLSSGQVDIKYMATTQINAAAIGELPLVIEDPQSASLNQDAPHLPLQLEPEKSGRAITQASIIKGAQALVNHGIPPDQFLGIELEPSPVHPEIRNIEMRTAINEFNMRTAVGIDVLLQGQVRRMTPEAYRESLEYSYNPAARRIEPHLNIETFQRNLEFLFADFVEAGRTALYSIDESGTPGLSVEGTNLGCCRQISEAQIEELLAGEKILEVETIVVDDQFLEEYEALQITEKVGSFSTSFFPDGSRAVNIFVATDALKGAVIFPGDTWSMNEHLGPRTADKGYVPASNVYYFGSPREYGGGAEQLATTLLNAAVLSGLEISGHEPHTVDFPEYPRGLDATLAWPTPDLRIHNPTPYGILIWTNFNRGVVTVDLYGMKFYETVEILPQPLSRIGGCTEVITNRIRTDSDGNELTDSFRAFYYPSLGINCNGSSIFEDSSEPSEETESSDERISPDLIPDTAASGN